MLDWNVISFENRRSIHCVGKFHNDSHDDDDDNNRLLKADHSNEYVNFVDDQVQDWIDKMDSYEKGLIRFLRTWVAERRACCSGDRSYDQAIPVTKETACPEEYCITGSAFGAIIT